MFVVADSVTAGYCAGLPIVRDVSVILKPGLIVLDGLSGVGKSTLLAVLAGVHRPSSGHVFWDDVDVYAGGVDLDQVGYIATSSDPLDGGVPSCWPSIVVADDVTFGVPRAVASKAVAMIDAARDAGSVVLVATTDPLLVRAADVVLKMDGGRLCQ